MNCVLILSRFNIMPFHICLSIFCRLDILLSIFRPFNNLRSLFYHFDILPSIFYHSIFIGDIFFIGSLHGPYLADRYYAIWYFTFSIFCAFDILSGADKYPPPHIQLQVSNRSDIGEVPVESSQEILFLKKYANFIQKVTSQIKVDSKIKLSLFAASATHTGLMPTANQNFAKLLPRGWRRYDISIGLILRKGQCQGHVQWRWKCCPLPPLLSAKLPGRFSIPKRIWYSRA